MIYWIWLSTLLNVGIHSQRKLLERFTTPEAVYRADKQELINVNGIGKKKAEIIYNTKSLTNAKQIEANCIKNGIKMMTLEDDIYPMQVKSIKDMPIILYYKGNPRTNSVGTSIVGARRCTKEAKKQAIEEAVRLSEKNIPVISGMAKGVDSYAHTACIKDGGYPIAVLANGLDICYPKEHSLLMQRIEEKGMLISEHEPGIHPQPHYFPMRNRIIAAWSNEIIVIGAGKKSGALITAEYGGEYNRRVIFIK